MRSKEYWNKKIIEWERSSYRGSSRDLSLIERIATKFRGPIRRRREILLGLLKGLIRDKTVLELGCGSGDLCLELLKLGARRIIGVDISDVAIKAAKEKAAVIGMQDKAEFFVMDIRNDISLPAADFVVGLGFIDYVDAESLKKLFARIRGRFIFSFPGKKANFINILHYAYLKTQKCPAFYKFSRGEFDNIAGMRDKCRFFTVDKMCFVANFDLSRQ